MIAESAIPPMTQQDIGELLTIAGAPLELHHPAYLNLFHARTRGHPVLVAATVRFLRGNGWLVDDISSIFTEDPTREVRTETWRKLVRLLPNMDARELLDRLSLIGAPFDPFLMRAVATVAPPIPRPAELFPEVAGPWVYQLAADRFEVSPLLSDAGQARLDPGVQQHVHIAVASYYLNKPTIDQRQGWQIIIHLTSGRDWHTLTGFLIRLSLQLNDKRQAEAFELITMFFSASLPEDMPVSSRIPFRAVQVRILTLLGKDAQALLTDLDKMIQGADISALPMGFLAHLLVGPLNPATSPGMAARRTLEACRSYRRLPPEMQQLSVEFSLEDLVWSGLMHIRSREDIRGILHVLTDMTPQERRAAFSPDELYEAAQIFVDNCWALELTRAEQEQDWEGVLAIVGEIRQVGELPGGEPLKAPAARARAIVLADHMARPQEALALLETALAGADHNARFLLQYTAGSILLDHSTPETALSRYQSALAESPTTYSTLQFDTLRRGAEAAGRIGQWPTMRDLAVSSLKLSRDDSLDYVRLEMIGELAWAHWALGEHIKAYGAMSSVVHGLLQKQEFEESRFREVFGKTGHVLGWMVSIEQSGAPPAHTLEGQPYAEPFPGFFSRPRPRIVEIPMPLHPSLLLTQLGMFAVACELDETAWNEFSQAKSLAESQGLTYLQHFVDLQLADLAARNEDYREAFHLTLSGIRSFPASQRFGESGADTLTDQILHEDVWAGLSQEQRQGLERMLYWTTIGPAITGLLAKDAHSDAYGTIVMELQSIFEESEHELVDPEYWKRMLRELRIVFSPLATPEILRGQIQALREDESLMRVLLYLAIANSDYGTLEECCGVQAVAFDFLLDKEPGSKLMTRYLAIYILRFWRHVVETQRFALHNPLRFRDATRIIQKPTFSNIALLLLLAENATGARFSDDLRRRLVESGQQA
jgi:tetratricopeptide (TPR) repeat protein